MKSWIALKAQSNQLEFKTRLKDLEHFRTKHFSRLDFNTRMQVKNKNNNKTLAILTISLSQKLDHSNLLEAFKMKDCKENFSESWIVALLMLWDRLRKELEGMKVKQGSCQM